MQKTVSSKGIKAERILLTSPSGAGITSAWLTARDFLLSNRGKSESVINKKDLLYLFSLTHRPLAEPDEPECIDHEPITPGVAPDEEVYRVYQELRD